MVRKVPVMSMGLRKKKNELKKRKKKKKKTRQEQVEDDLRKAGFTEEDIKRLKGKK